MTTNGPHTLTAMTWLKCSTGIDRAGERYSAGRMPTLFTSTSSPASWQMIDVLYIVTIHGHGGGEGGGLPPS